MFSIESQRCCWPAFNTREQKVQLLSVLQLIGLSLKGLKIIFPELYFQDKRDERIEPVFPSDSTCFRRFRVQTPPVQACDLSFVRLATQRDCRAKSDENSLCAWSHGWNLLGRFKGILSRQRLRTRQRCLLLYANTGISTHWMRSFGPRDFNLPSGSTFLQGRHYRRLLPPSGSEVEELSFDRRLLPRRFHKGHSAAFAKWAVLPNMHLLQHLRAARWKGIFQLQFIMGKKNFKLIKIISNAGNIFFKFVDLIIFVWSYELYLYSF